MAAHKALPAKRDGAQGARPVEEATTPGHLADDLEHMTGVSPASGMQVEEGPYSVPHSPEMVNPQTGEVTVMNIYRGIASDPFTPEQKAKLLEPVDPLDIEIRPDGLIYYSAGLCRRRLNMIFGPGAWAIMPIGEVGFQETQSQLYYKAALYINGAFVAQAIGEAEYHENNNRQSYATAAESAKSNALVRCCKDIGIAGELWEPQFARRWRDEYAVEIWCENTETKKRRKMWRKKSDPPYEQFPWREMEDRGSAGGAAARSDARSAPRENPPASRPASATKKATRATTPPDTSSTPRSSPLGERPWDSETLRKALWAKMRTYAGWEHQASHEDIEISSRILKALYPEKDLEGKTSIIEMIVDELIPDEIADEIIFPLGLARAIRDWSRMVQPDGTIVEQIDEIVRAEADALRKTVIGLYSSGHASSSTQPESGYDA